MTTSFNLNWLDLGVSDPLTLGMAHPLADRLEYLASPKINKGVTRTVTAALILAVGTLTAPLTIAEDHPEHSLPDTVISSQKSKSVIKVTRKDDNGNEVKKHYEIELNGDEFEAYEVDVAGRKTKVDLSEIEGFDAEKAKNSKSWSFSVGDDNKLKFMTGEDVRKHKGIYGFLNSKNSFPSANKSIHVYSSDEKLREGLKGLDALDLEENHQNIRVFSADKELKEALKSLESLEGLEKLEALKSLEGLKGLAGLEALESLEGLEGLKVLENMRGKIVIEAHDDEKGGNTFSWSGDFSEFPERFKGLEDKEFFKIETGGSNAFFLKQGQKASKEARLAIAKSMLENAENMLQDMDDLEESKSELAQAMRDLKKAREALKDAQKKNNILGNGTSKSSFEFDKNASFIGEGMQFSNSKLVDSDGPVTILQDGKPPIVIEDGVIITGPKATKAIKDALKARE